MSSSQLQAVKFSGLLKSSRHLMTYWSPKFKRSVREHLGMKLQKFMCQNWDKVKKRPWYYTSLWTWASISRTDVDLCSGLTMSALKEKWSEDQLCCYNEPVLIKPFSFSWGLWKIGNMLPHIRLLNSYNLSGYNWDIFFPLSELQFCIC